MSADIDTLSYEEALAQLDGLIAKLEGGSIALEEAIDAYERGAKLAQHCTALLDRTDRRVAQLVVGADGGMTERPLDPTPVPAAAPAPAAQRLFADPPPVRPGASRVDPDDVPF